MSIWAIVTLFAITGVANPGVLAQESARCESPGQSNIDICDPFLTVWESFGESPLPRDPITEQFDEFHPDGAPREVQYFEGMRFELHPDQAETPYNVQLGRLGAELLAFEGVDWTQLPKAEPHDDHYMSATGQAIGSDFWPYWSGHGLDLGDEGVSFRESLALFGYPLTPPQDETDEGGRVVRVQWFERARLEMDESGDVRAAPLGSELGADDGQLSVRVQRELTAAMQEAIERGASDGVYARIESPAQGTWSGAAGFADPEAEAPYTSETRHRIGSVTKTMVATIVLQLADEGMFSLDDTVEDWFPDAPNAEEITIRMLGNMTSGIFNYSMSLSWQQAYQDDPERVWQPDELLEYAFEMPASFDPGGDWEYSNTNYVMLGMIIEAVTGNDLVSELEARIFDPIGLDATVYPDPEDASMVEPFASGMTRVGLSSEPVDATGWNPSWAASAGQIYSTPADLSRWVAALASGELISDEAYEEQRTWVDVMPEEAVGSYGFGLLEDSGWIGHDGVMPGYVTLAFARSDIDLGVVVLANSDILSDEEMLTAGVAMQHIIRVIDREYPQAGQG